MSGFSATSASSSSLSPCSLRASVNAFASAHVSRKVPPLSAIRATIPAVGGPSRTSSHSSSVKSALPVISSPPFVVFRQARPPRRRARGPSGRWVISSTVRSPDAASTSSISRSAVGSVEMRGRLVQHQHRRVGEQRARERDPLPLPARELATLLADERVEAVRERAHPVPRSAPRRAPARPRRRSRRAAPRRTLSRMRRREQVRVLAGDGDRAADVLLPVLAQVAAGERHPPASGSRKRSEQVRDRRLARAARADERDPAGPARAGG